MPTRIVEGKKPYTGGKAISIDENKVISLNLRDENNLIIYDEGDDEIYVDLQLDDEITPTDAFPIGVNVGRVIVDNGWDLPGTIISAVTTSGDNIKIFYADVGTLWIDNGTGTFKQIYFKADVDALLLALRNYIDGELAKKQNGVSSDTAPSNPSEGDLWYDTANSAMKVWDGTAWQSVGGGDVLVSTQANNIFTPGMKIWGGTESDYQSLTPDSNTAYLLLAGGPTPPSPWQPGVDTILYYDFEHTSGTTETNLATTGVSYDGIYSTTPTIGTLASGKKYFSSAGNNYAVTDSGFGIVDYSNSTVCVWLNHQGGTAAFFGQSRRSTPGGGTASGLGTIFCEHYSGNYSVELGQTYGHSFSDSLMSGWSCLVLTGDNGNFKAYVNGNLVVNDAEPYVGQSNSTQLCVGSAFVYGNQTPSTISNTWFGSIIIENKVRTAQEIQDYFDQTKANYGIS